VVAIYADDELKEGKTAIIQLLKNRFGETIEKGIRVSAVPELSYIGDFKDDDMELIYSAIYLQNFISGLIRGSI